MNQWAEKQPKHGDIIVHCGHLPANHAHFFNAPMVLKFCRPDGTFGETHWIAACTDCFTAAEGDPLRVIIQSDGVWQGDEPTIKAPD